VSCINFGEIRFLKKLLGFFLSIDVIFGQLQQDRYPFLFNIMVFTGEVPIGLTFNTFASEYKLRTGHIFVYIFALHKKHGVEVNGELGGFRVEGIDSFNANDIDGSFWKFVKEI
jgi:hypothetical protein